MQLNEPALEKYFKGAVVSERCPHRTHPLRRLLLFVRYSFALRAALVMTLGTMMSCTSCSTLSAIAQWAGCNCDDGEDSSSSGCGGDDEEGWTYGEETECGDGSDNDDDGDVDCEDVDCRRAGVCGEYYCYDERDDDGDGAVDCDDSDCCHYEWCRCHCEAQCEAGTTLCIADEEPCSYECCPSGETCIEGRCTSCANECSEGNLPCWTGEGLCAHECCAPGQACGADGCQCALDCSDSTNPCIVDQATCAYECCGSGDVCRSGGCSPYSCTASLTLEEGSHEFDIDWNEYEDIFNVAELEGCAESEGSEALFEVRVPPGEVIMIDRESSPIGGLHIVDGCPPTRCVSSLGDAPESTTLWLNSSGVEQRVWVMLESGEQEHLTGILQVSRFTGEACDDAIEVFSPSDGFSWTAKAELFQQWGEGDLCGIDPQRHLWFAVDVDASKRLNVAAWGGSDDFTPSITVVGGACGEPTCLVVGEDMVSLLNDLQELQSLYVVIGWSADYEGDVNVDLFTE